MTKKRVLIISDFFIPHWTGIVTSLSYFIDRYNHVYDFSVLTINHTNCLPPYEIMNHIKIMRVPYQFSISRAKFSFFYFPQYLSLLNRCDVVFINSPSNAILLFAVCARLFKKRVIIFHQGDLILTQGILNRVIEKLFDFQTHLSCKVAHALATYTQDYASYSRILSKYKNKLHTFLFIPKKSKTPTQSLQSLEKMRKQGFFIYGFAGRFVEEKGIDILLSAIAQVVQTNKKVHFYFAGDTPQYEKNSFFSENNPYVTNVGLLSASDMKSFLSSLDYLIIPSRSDCFPLVQVEALLEGTPIIASNIPGLRVPVSATKYGFLFEKENSSDLAKKILISLSERKNISRYKHAIDVLLNPLTYDSAIRTFIGK